MLARPLSILVLLLPLALFAAGATGLAQTRAGARALESRLYAPCCWGGTLDIHESELATTLRREIESRLATGETSEAVQADLVARYGDEILAARSDAPIRQLGVVTGALLVLSAVALGLLVSRWTRKRGGTMSAPRARDELDDRIDAELADQR